MQSSRLQPTGSYQAGAPRLLPTCRDRCSQPGASRPAPGPARAQPRTAPQAHSGCSEAKVDLSTPSRRLSLTALCRRAAAYTRTAFGFVSSLRASVVCQASSSKRGSTSGASSPKRDDDAALHDEPGDSSQAMSESVSKDDVIAIIKRFPGPGQGKWIGFINKHWDTICWDGITAKDSPAFLLEFLHYQQHELEPDDAVVTMSPARMQLLGTKPSSMTVSLMKQITRLAKGPAYLCYRPEYVGPPQQLPATLVHEAFGVVRKGLTDTSKLPSINAQHLALQLTDIMPEVYPSELIRRTTWLGVFKEWLDLEFGGKLIIKQGVVVEVPGSEYVVDAVIMTQDGRWVAVFEFKQDEQRSYEQGQSYFAQRLNVMKPEERGAGIHPAFLIEECGPSLRLCAMYLAGPVPSSPDIQAMVCEPLTPQQHFFHMPQDYPYMLSLARMLDSFKDGLAKLVEDPQIDQG